MTSVALVSSVCTFSTSNSRTLCRTVWFSLLFSPRSVHHTIRSFYGCSVQRNTQTSLDWLSLHLFTNLTFSAFPSLDPLLYLPSCWSTYRLLYPLLWGEKFKMYSFPNPIFCLSFFSSNSLPTLNLILPGSLFVRISAKPFFLLYLLFFPLNVDYFLQFY